MLFRGKEVVSVMIEGTYKEMNMDRILARHSPPSMLFNRASTEKGLRLQSTSYVLELVWWFSINF